MRVVLIHQAFVSSHEAGGTRHVELGRHLVSTGDRLTVVASQLNYLTGQPIARRRPQPRFSLFSRDADGGIDILRAYAPPILHKGFGWRIIAFLAFAITSVWAGLRAGPADLVMGTSPPIFQAVSALVVARIRRKPFLLEIRDLWPEFAIEMGVLRNPVLQWLSRWLERFLYRAADHLLVNSPAYRDYLITKGVPSDKISFVPNGVDTSMFAPNDRGQTVRQRFNIGSDFLAVYAGAHGAANDLGTILDAADLLRDRQEIRFLFVGDGKERERLQSAAKTRGLTNVTFAGPVPKSEMPQVLAAADVCLATLQNIPMFTTTYPNKVFDYMAAGRPTILAIDGVIRQTMEEATGGIFVPPGNAPALAEAIQRLWHDDAERTTMGRAAHTYVETHFDRGAQAEQFRQVLHQVAVDRGDRRRHKKP